jgi:hypothetical protein
MFLNAMYGGLGQSLGAIIGGKLQSKFGTVKTFVYSGIFDLCFVGFVTLYLRVRKDSSFRDPKPIGRQSEEPVLAVEPHPAVSTSMAGMQQPVVSREDEPRREIRSLGDLPAASAGGVAPPAPKPASSL